MRACVRAYVCVRACACVCVRVCVCACARAREREREREGRRVQIPKPVLGDVCPSLLIPTLHTPGLLGPLGQEPPTLINTHITLTIITVRLVQHRVVSGEVLAGAEVPGGGDG